MSLDACASLTDRRAMQVAAEFAAAGQGVESTADLNSLLGAAAGELGFGFHALVQHGRPARAPEPQLALLDYPASWQDSDAYRLRVQRLVRSARAHLQEPLARKWFTS